MAKRKVEKDKTIYQTLHRKLKIDQHEPPKTGGEIRFPEGQAVTARLVTLHFFHSGKMRCQTTKQWHKKDVNTCMYFTVRSKLVLTNTILLFVKFVAAPHPL
jgi:hypothetical protein